MAAERPTRKGAGADDASALCTCDAATRQDEPRFRRSLRPHRALGRRGQAAVLLVLAVGLALPLIPLILRGVAAIMLIFAGLAIWALATALRRNMQDRSLREDIALWPDLMSVTRQEPDGRLRHWCADPVSVRLHLNAKGPPEQYLTLTGGPRDIELGAFLTPEARRALHDDLELALRFCATPT